MKTYSEIELTEILSEHSKWLEDPVTGKKADLREADLRGADLRRADLGMADLRRADLREANLRGADLDFSSLPLWCGSFKIKTDLPFVRQLLYHICMIDNNSKAFSEIKRSIRVEANKATIIEKYELKEIGEEI